MRKMPWEIKQQVLWIVRYHERNRREYEQQRAAILDASGSGNMATYTVNGETRLAVMPSTHQARRTTEDRQMQLEALEQTALARNFHAVEDAYKRLGRDLPPRLRAELRDAIKKNCASGRAYPYERLTVTGLCRSDFYRRKDEFVADIAEGIGLWRQS